MDGKEKAKSAIEIFEHIRTAHQDSSLPSSHFRPVARMGWLANLTDMEAGEDDKENFFQDERLQTLSILKEKERDILAVEMTIGRAVNDHVSAALVENRLRLAISIKAQGRKDLINIVGGVKQSISIPTQLSKVRKIASSYVRGNGKEQTEEDETIEER